MLSPDEENNLEFLFRYHKPDDAQLEQIGRVRQCAFELAKVILANCPRSQDRTAAVRNLRECVFFASASIKLRGQNLL